jgi:hypothetical protein
MTTARVPTDTLTLALLGLAERGERKGAGARLSLLTLRADPCAPNQPTAINSKEKCKKVHSFFLMGSLRDRQVSLLPLSDAQGKIPVGGRRRG